MAFGPDMSIYRRELRVAALTGLAIVAAYVVFTLLTLPKPPEGIRILAINKGIFDSMTQAFQTNWTRLLWPMEYEMNRIYWPPATLFPTYAAERFLGPLASYLLFSCLFIGTAFALAFYVTRSLVFAATLGFMFAFGTQLNYTYTYGSLIPLYLILTFCAVNLTIVVMLLREEVTAGRGYLAFAGSLCLIALSSEWWINYAIALISAAAFGVVWAQWHVRPVVTRVCAFVIVATIATLAVYLLIRLQYPGQFTRYGEEEELLLTYTSPVMMVEDFLTNFFTFLYMSLDNYLPSFVSSSNSLTYLGPEKIIAEQHGYHAQYQHLVVMSHLFMWRFYAGIAATVFVGLFILVVRRAWKSPAWHHAVIACLMLMVATGFATHLAIKMRPYNSVPGLSYKVVFSVSALTILVAYLVMTEWRRLSSPRSRWVLLGAVWLCVAAAAITRPGMQQQLLGQVGLVGFRDPLGQILSVK
ncbi:hypothetical protein [Microvirga antarctica]|uniref:hypothetical protein n=1 Tax=Microvirga antarctica TaxID=2819233 RepID=UPI001B309A2E|nr:hypothetical protein [Microvirga antarctica]